MEKFDNNLKEKNSSLCLGVKQNNNFPVCNCNMRKFSDVLKELRLEKGLSLLALSKQTSISHTSLCRYENNKADISGENLITLANFYNVSVDYILGLKD